jgi:RecA/RadA recombinase/intein/homing endonuclease
MARAKTSAVKVRGDKAKVTSKPLTIADRFKAYTVAVLDGVEKSEALHSGFSSAKRLSFGLLTTDLISGGGITPGMYSISGMEASAKSTQAQTILGSALNANIPIILYFDAENAVDPNYTGKILRVKRLRPDVFGQFDSKTQTWIVAPRARYYDTSVLEKVYRTMQHTLNSLPDKIYREDLKKWFLVFRNKKDHIAAKNAMGLDHDKGMFTKTGRYWCPIDDENYQALFVIDSYPALLAEDVDEEEKEGNALALEAQGFAKWIKRVKGKLRQKAAIIIGVNQIREKPMVQHGSPIYEPGGNALKFYCMTGDTCLFTDKGMLTAEEMYYNPTKKVLGQSKLENLENFSYQGHSQIISVTTKFGYQVKGKPGHRVLALKSGNTVPKFEELSKLYSGKNGYYLPVKVGAGIWPSKNPNFGYKSLPSVIGDKVSQLRNIESWQLPSTMDTNLAKVLGYLIGDGHVKGGTIFFSSIEEESRQAFVLAFSKAFSIKKSKLNKYCVSNKGVCVSNIEIGAFLTYLGCGEKSSWQKNVPWAIRTSIRDCQTAFLQTLFDSDGSASLDGKSIAYSSVSKSLIQQVQLMLLNLGIICRVNYHDNWYAHGYDKGGLDHPKNNGLTIYGEMVSKFFDVCGFCLTRKNIISKEREKVNNKGNSLIDVFPKVAFWREHDETISKRLENIITVCIEAQRSKNWRYSDFIGPWYKRVLDEISNLRTEQEREKCLRQLENFESLVKYTLSNDIYWVLIDKVSTLNERAATYDGTAIETHTILTNGIVSHNSDVRFQMAHRVVPDHLGFPRKKDNSSVCEEPSVQIDGGTDEYAFKHIKNTKNKFGTPFLDGWTRVWIKDARGQGRGFDPVFDTFYYLKTTGQLSGSFKRGLKIEHPAFLKIKGMIAWYAFKALILAEVDKDKELEKWALAEIGLKQTVKLREFCFKQVASGEGTKLYYAAQLSTAETDDGLEDLEE